MARKARLTKASIKEALTENKGGVYLAASQLGVSHTTVYKALKKYPDLQELKESFDGKMVDKAEYNLVEAVESGDPWALKFVLSTKGKERGYTERQEITGADGAPLTWKQFIEDDDDE